MATDEYRTFKVILNVRVKNPERPFPAGGDFTHKNLIDGIAHQLSHLYLPESIVTLDKVAEVKKGQRVETYADMLTGVLMVVERDIPEHPKITVICPDDRVLSIEQVNDAIHRLHLQADMAPAQFPDVVQQESGNEH